jgi:hypothetical protein
MKIFLFTVLNCKGCAAHLKELHEFCTEANLVLRVYDIDSEKHVMLVLTAMRKYGIRKTPSIVLIKEDGFESFQGIENSINELKEKITHD